MEKNMKVKLALQHQKYYVNLLGNVGLGSPRLPSRHNLRYNLCTYI